MISAKRVEELREAWGKFSVMDNISVSKHTLIELHDTLSAALKVVDLMKEFKRAIDRHHFCAERVNEVLAPFTSEPSRSGKGQEEKE